MKVQRIEIWSYFKLLKSPSHQDVFGKTMSRVIKVLLARMSSQVLQDHPNNYTTSIIEQKANIAL